MYRIILTTFSLLLVLSPGGLTSELTDDGTIKDLYKYLLQREYAAPVAYADHQIKRKAVRSPSLRLRFGRRSDPSMPVKPDDELLESRSVRAPKLRLRFGRSDPWWPLFNENALLENYFEKRVPSQRLRWGRSGELFPVDDVMKQKTIRAPQLRLRFGRSDPSWMIYNEHIVDDKQLADATPKPLPQFRLGQVDDPMGETNEQTDTDESESRNMDNQ
ncbi:short neuropeptide F [Wyeomyia smithii]|uniref:short neuropeptide F n=1 Tax=Wyeomyia smithii TaxID=174621 RepID=UPI002467ED99|nr:short neuropeptide F [Wyeomyia smithii]XP_055539483.1 short neuropeptide F [Wyeomyia smithii]XP_055539484.1 short neuropeptide F [Wyeomyia smithii]XP_055539485.1 short neuropeptide F [Wyeomyia smithii]XP_055539486.1 short neuropeptide F [Wyeomyia smithii]XP_055539487.1 short neuropeptide F [Wyeomyia smithii]XP_055539488.1 short neuropeptide F [Wyeomyia smithii]